MINKAKTRQQIALEYGVCTKTLKKWINSEGIFLKGGLITPAQQNLIYAKLGYPKNSETSQNIPKFS